MGFVGGDFEEVHCSHPEYGQMRFYPKANETFNVDYGGISSNDDENGVTSAGDLIDQMNRRRWSVEGPIAIDFAGSQEETFLNNVAKSPTLGTWTFTHISGAVWRGQGKPVGTRSYDTNAGTLSLKIAGSRQLENIN